MLKTQRAIVAAVLLFYIFQAFGYAHEGGGEAGFSSGILHPVMGFDHVVVMLGVGFWGYQIGRPSLWILPLVFLAAMLSGAVLGIFGMPLYSVEIVIAFSGIAMGLFIAMDERYPLWLSIPVVAIFALFHGYAHGVELPSAAHPLMYITGFSIMTSLLMALGIGLANVLKKPSYKGVGIRIVGILITIIGGLFLSNILMS